MEYPEKRRITWVDDETGELVGACDYYRHDLLEATQAEIERLRREVHVAKSAMVRNHRRAEKAEAEIARLTKERDTDHANINLKADFIEATINQLALAEAERDEARAQVAAAFVAAEKALESRKYGDPDEREEYAFDAALDRGIVAIRALASDHAKAALEAYGLEKVREGMQRAADIAEQCWQSGYRYQTKEMILAEMEDME
jgi:hypothetical protein